MEEVSDSQVNERLMQHLYMHSRKTSFFNVLLAIIVLFNFKLIDHIELSRHYVWFSLMVMLACSRFYCAHIALSTKKRMTDIRYHAVLSIILFLTGMIWGSVYFYFYAQTSVFVQMLILLVIAGVSSASTVSLSASPWCFYGLVLPTIVLVLWKNAAVGSIESISVVLVMLTYVGFLIVIFPANHKLLIQNILMDLQQKKLIEQLKKFNEQLSLVSITDDLTKLANRRHFSERLLADWIRAKRSRLQVSLLLIDVDYFKQYNDNYGHLAGDDCLQRVAGIIKSEVHRETDLAARVGGDEIAVILFSTSQKNAVQLAQRIAEELKKVAIEHKYSPVSGYVTLSIGVSSRLPSIDDGYEVLINCADKALYKAKEQGRNTIATF